MEAGQAVTATGAFTDAGASDTHSVTFDWGDGSPTTTKSLAAGVNTFSSAAHTYTAAGDFTVTAKVTDNAGAFATRRRASASTHRTRRRPSRRSS